MAAKRRRAKRMRLLERLYDRLDGLTSQPIELQDIANLHGISHGEALASAQELADRGLVELLRQPETDIFFLKLTVKGADEVERWSQGWLSVWIHENPNRALIIGGILVCVMTWLLNLVSRWLFGC